MSQLTGPFNGDVKPAPGPTDHSNDAHYEAAGLNTPCDGSVIKPAVMAVGDSLKASPGALDTPMGTAIPNVGGGFKAQG